LQEGLAMKVSVIGPTGYTGRELVRILLRHGKVEDFLLFGRQEAYFHKEYPEFLGVCEKKIELLEAQKAVQGMDAVFIALPHKVSMEVTPLIRQADKKIKIIDLSADYRLTGADIYKRAYGVEHKDPGYLGKYVYGLCEANREAIRQARFVANPGCYPTSVLIPLIPLMEKGMLEGTVIADCKSGASGAGKSLSQMLHFVECNENIVPYKIFQHQHAYEMAQFMGFFDKSLDLIFTPQLLPIDTGILTVLYIKLKKSADKEKVKALYLERFAGEKFVRVLPESDMPTPAKVRNSNFCDINVFADKQKEYIIVVSAIDNLIKGGSGQAVQNLNIMSGLEEGEGLL
jgi:N-acetyl-gamma-glutamyl-phosphate reductase